MTKVIGSALFPFVFLLTATAVWMPPLLPPVTQEQIAAWLTGGLSTEQIAFEIKSRGINFAPTDMVAALRLASGSTIENAVEVAQVKGEPQQLSLEETRSIDYLIESFHAIQAKQFATAQKNLIQALRIRTDNADVYFAIGNLFRQQEQWQLAMAMYDKSVQLAPTFPYSHEYLSYAYYRLGDARSAVTQARYMVLDRPADATGYKFMGLAWEADNQFDDAMDAYQKALLIRPDYADVYFDIGVLMDKMKQWDKAITAYEKTAKLDPGRAATFYNLGLAQERRGDLEGSILSYEKAKELAPDDLRVRQDLGAELCNAGRHQQAIEEFQALLALAPDWNMARPCLYKSLLAVGRAEEAKQVMQDYLRFESDAGNPK